MTGTSLVADAHRTYVIAEAASTHDGELIKALGLVDVAAESGADAVKFQYWSSGARLARRRNAPAYREVYERYQVPEDWLPALRMRADRNKVDFVCTSFLPEDVEVIAPHVHHFKIASFESNSPGLLVAHAPFMSQLHSRHLFISMGMGAAVGPIRAWLTRPMTDHFGASWGNAGRIVFLHCVSAYPTPVEQLNIRALNVQLLGEDGPRFEGYSDHAEPDHTWTGALAVAAGAAYVERHIRLDETADDNPDCATAMRPRAFAEYVRHIRFAEAALGSGQRQPQAVEAPMRALMVRE